MTYHGSFIGSQPGIKISAGNPEAEKYGRLWEMEQYRRISPGEDLAQLFLQIARPCPGAEVIDFGCGTGRGSLALALFGRLKIAMIDFVSNSLDPEIRDALSTQSHALKFLKHDLEKPLPLASQYGFCTDVMEHIPPAKVDVVLDNILHAAEHVFFSISTVEDRLGALIGAPLHLTVQPYAWWLEQFKKRDCLIYWSGEQDGACFFYVRAWQDGRKIVEAGELNYLEEKVRENVRHNCAQGWNQVAPHAENEFELMILGGGPSLGAFETEIKERRASGTKLLTLNGAYNWALDHGLVPSAQVVVDARPFNARFTKPVVDACKYLIASQCDPAVLQGLPRERTFLWHTSTETIRDLLSEAYKIWWAIPGGSTVLLRAIPLMRLLGYRKFILYGCDSCLQGDAHHAYSQPENDGDRAFAVTVTGGRIFYCYPWQLAQAQEFMDLVKFLGDQIEMQIRGDGLISHILEIGARIAERME